MTAELASPLTPEAPLPNATEGKSSYVEILKSSVLIGGSSVLNLVIGAVRTKLMAMVLGPAGFGLMGVYTSIADLARSLAEMGINSSGVRQIAESAGSGDSARLVRTVVVLRRVAIVLGLIGALLLITLAFPISHLTFGSSAEAGGVALLSAAVFLRLVSDGQGALLQGMRRIGDMARIGVLGALLGTLASVPIVYALGKEGVVVALVAIAAASALVSWWTVRRIPLPSAAPTMTVAEVRKEVSAMLGLGLAFMASGFLMMGAAYAVRLLIVRHDGLVSAGLYQAAWTIGGLYVGFVLQAMGADFYPRLVEASKNNPECNRLVNEQAQVSLLLAGCGVLATLTFAPWIFKLLYSGAFEAGTEVLRWIVLGMAMRVVTWPMGYILVAKGAQTLFVATDLAWAVGNIGLTWIGVRLFGLPGAGMAFFGSYVLHLLIVYPAARRLSGFRWSAVNLRTGLLFAAVIGAVFTGFQCLDATAATALGGVATAVSAAWSLRTLHRLVGTDRVPKRLTRLLKFGKDAR
jgi:antigen flippase